MPLHIVTEAERCLNCKKPQCQKLAVEGAEHAAEAMMKFMEK